MTDQFAKPTQVSRPLQKIIVAGLWKCYPTSSIDNKPQIICKLPEGDLPYLKLIEDRFILEKANKMNTVIDEINNRVISKLKTDEKVE